MFNFFNFFKKNKLEQPEIIEKKVSDALPEPVKTDDVVIHVMPERFRHQPVKQSNAKTTGLVIIVSGAMVLIVASAALYYFLLRQPSATVVQKPPAAAENNQPPETAPTVKIPEVITATGTETATLSLGGESATTTAATTTPENAPPAQDLNLRAGADRDNDGLTDLEETLLGVSSTTPDTDGDGYLDGAELINLYNPAGAGKLTANAHISLYENKTFAYDLLYPSAWTTSINGGDDSLMFKSGDNQFVQIIAQPNANKETLDAWYMEQLAVLTINEADRASGSNWQGLKSPDSLNVYLMDKKQNYIFSLTYNPGNADVLDYSNIFKMMIKSFNLKD
ncbi:MAG: hypothetical protein HYV53_00710 [Parcubacteria group bacterium]|nr:hypothetical protein [Parcubacteria group bacterium]